MFEKLTRIKSTMVDHNQILHLRSMFELCEDLEMEDLIKINYPYKEALKKNLIWIVSKSSFNIIKLPHYGDEVKLSTHAKTHSKLIFPRSYIFRNNKDELLIEGESRWALLEMNTRKILIPEKLNISFGANTNEDKDFDYNFDVLDTPNFVERNINYSDLDINNHVNNTKYASWIDDIIKDNKNYKKVKVAFHKEIKKDDIVKICYSDLNKNIIYFVGLVNDIKCFEFYLEY